VSKWDYFVYSYVALNAIDTILTEGLYGGKALLNRPDLLGLAAKGHKISKIKFKNKIEKQLRDPFWKPVLLGPNIVFQLIPNLKMVSSIHPVRKNKLVPIKINLTQLLTDYPETKIFGMELKPFGDEEERSHYLNLKELIHLLGMSPKELWSKYDDQEDKGLYAPNVPHASIHTESGIIYPKYLQEIKISYAINDIYKLAKLFEKFYKCN
jgi:hypothetical protein